MINTIDAILSLLPGAEVVVSGDNVTWIIPAIAPITDAQIATELVRLQSLEITNQYKINRSLEYPNIADYLDGIVKGDIAQQQAYITACLEVKAKYPKPT